MFAGIGTVVNAAAIIAGSLVGLTIKKGLSEKLKTNLNTSVAIAVFVLGISGALSKIFTLSGKGETLTENNLLLMVISLAIGTVIGVLIKLDIGFEKLGNYMGSKFSKGESGKFAQGLVSASIIFCVGAMAIVGSIEDGMMGNPKTLYIKSILDGITSMILATSFGVGVLFSAAAVLIYQGTITLAAVLFAGSVSAEVITQTSIVGNVLIMCIGINMLKIKKINVAAMLPSAFIPAIYAIIKSIF